MGTRLREDISELVAARKALYSTAGNMHWRELAEQMAPSIQLWAPQCWAELQGMVQAGVPLEDLLLMCCDYEMQMESWANGGEMRCDPAATPSGEEKYKVPEGTPAGRCTGFAVNGPRGSILAQNVDEPLEGWDDGLRDIVLRHIDEKEREVLVYTHPGVPAYCGMNSSGLCVANFYIEDSSRGKGGVPIDVILRELLKFDTIEQAVDWLETIPRSLPTTCMLMQHQTIVCVEVTADRTVAVWVKGSNGRLCHANHPLLDQTMQGSNTPNESSLNRQQVMQKSVHEAISAGGIDGAVAKELLTKCPPVHPVYAPTIAAVVMEPAGQSGNMHVKFIGENKWLRASFTNNQTTDA